MNEEPRVGKESKIVLSRLEGLSLGRHLTC